MQFSEIFYEFSKKYDETVTEIFNILSESIQAGTFFISRTTEETFSILKVLNQDGCNIEEGQMLPLEQAY